MTCSHFFAGDVCDCLRNFELVPATMAYFLCRLVTFQQKVLPRLGVPNKQQGTLGINAITLYPCALTHENCTHKLASLGNDNPAHI